MRLSHVVISACNSEMRSSSVARSSPSPRPLSLEEVGEEGEEEEEEGGGGGCGGEAGVASRRMSCGRDPEYGAVKFFASDVNDVSGVGVPPCRSGAVGKGVLLRLLVWVCWRDGVVSFSE